MVTLLILFFPLVAAILVFASGNKLASKVALALSVFELIITYYVYNLYKQNGAESFYYFKEWIADPKISFHLGLDGLSLLMVMLTNLLSPVIVLSAFNRKIENEK